MSDYDDDNDGIEDTPLVRQLRKQIEKLTKTNGSLTDELTTLRGRTRADDIKSFLPEGVNPKAVKFFPPDQDVTAETVKAWLDENADLFPVTSSASNTPENQGDGSGSLSGDAQAALTRINQMGSSTDQTPDINSAKEQSMRELQAKQSQMTTDQYVAELNKILLSS